MPDEPRFREGTGFVYTYWITLHSHFSQSPIVFTPHGVMGEGGFNIVKDWCLDQFGPVYESHDIYGDRQIDDDGRWYVNSCAEFGFRNDDDAFAFKMRWC